MKIIIKLLGILLILSGAFLLFNPDFLYSWLKGNLDQQWLYISAIVGRLFFGIIFILAAGQSKYPGVIKFFGYLAVIASVIFILIGHESFQHFIGNIIFAFKPYAPVSGLLVMAFGAFVVYAFTGKS